MIFIILILLINNDSINDTTKHNNRKGMLRLNMGPSASDTNKTIGRVCGGGAECCQFLRWRDRDARVAADSITVRSSSHCHDSSRSVK